MTNGLKFFQTLAKAQIPFSTKVRGRADKQIAKWETLQSGCL